MQVAWQVLLFHKNQILLRVKLLKAKTESGFHAAIKINSLSSLEQSPRGYVESCASKGIEYSCFFSLHLLDLLCFGLIAMMTDHYSVLG
ncbi:hypothetical protein V6N13_085178 [Hibiscus sabdariffa]